MSSPSLPSPVAVHPSPSPSPDAQAAQQLSPMRTARKKAPAVAESAASPSPPAAKDKKQRVKAPCFEFTEKGSCASAECAFSHDAAEIEAFKLAQKQRACGQFARGECERGDACRYSHDAAIQSAAAAARAARDEARSAKLAAAAARAAAAAAAVPVASPSSTPSPPLPETLPHEPALANGNGLGVGHGAGASPDMTHLWLREHISAKKQFRRGGAQLQNKPFIIGVAGGTASGKTTVCDDVCEKLGLGRVALLQMDRFYKSLPANKPAEKHNFDVPEAFDWPLFVSTLRQLSTGSSVQVPQYSFETHQRLEKLDTFHNADVIIVEGILVLHDQKIRDQFDLKVFVEADSDVRLGRRILRDIAERGRSVDGVINQYINTVKPAHERYIQPTLRYSDIIIPHNGPKNGLAIDLLVQHIGTEIYKRGAAVRAISNKKRAAANKGKKKEGSWNEVR